MNNIILEYNMTGNCLVDVDLICCSWDNKSYLLSSWQDQFTFSIQSDSSERPSMKAQISGEQAKEIINAMKLIKTDTIFSSGKSYFTRESLLSSIDKTDDLIKEKEGELYDIKNDLSVLRDMKTRLVTAEDLDWSIRKANGEDIL